MREIDAEYYGYLDDDDDLLLGQEKKCELKGDSKFCNFEIYLFLSNSCLFVCFCS